MNLGTLVAKKMRWSINSSKIGVIVDKSDKKDHWIVLWSQDDSYKIQEHLADALIDLRNYSEKELKHRKCTSM